MSPSPRTKLRLWAGGQFPEIWLSWKSSVMTRRRTVAAAAGWSSQECSVGQNYSSIQVPHCTAFWWARVHYWNIRSGLFS